MATDSAFQIEARINPLSDWVGCLDRVQVNGSSLFSVGNCQGLGAPKRQGRKVEGHGQCYGKWPAKNLRLGRAKPDGDVAPSGRRDFSNPIPRALPRAVDFRPFGVSEPAPVVPLETAKYQIR
jgi:hypothetical protein